MKLTIGKVKLVFLHLKEPSKPAGTTQKEKYSCVVLFKMGGKVETQLRNSFDELVQDELANKNSKWKGKLPDKGKFENVFGNAGDKFEAEWADGYRYFTPKSERQVSVVKEGKKGLEIVKGFPEDLVYDGMHASVSVTLFTYTHDSGGKGVSAFLNSIKVHPGGERLELQFNPINDFKEEAQQEEEIEDEI